MQTVLTQIADHAKKLNWTNQMVRRNPLHYGNIDRVFARLDSATLDERRFFIGSRLKNTLRAASKTMYGKSVGGNESLESWPIIDKETVHRIGYQMLPRGARIRIPASTSGTTGVPLRFFRSPMSVVVEQVCVDRILRECNLNLKTAKIAVLRGETVKAPGDTTSPFWRTMDRGQRIIMSSNHLTSATVQQYFSLLETEKVSCLMVYPSTLELLCLLLQKADKSLNIPVVMTSSEVVVPKLHKLATSVLHCQMVDFYGQSERVSAAYTVGGNQYYFLPGYAYVELMYQRNDGDVDLYEIIGTSLWNSAMPLIRYRTGDFIAIPCGTNEAEKNLIRYGLMPFSAVHGRDMEYVRTMDGARIANVNHIARDIQHVLRMQIIQEEIDRLRILIVSDDNFTEADVKQILDNTYTQIPRSTSVIVERVEQVERTRAGKAPFVIRRNPEW